MVVRLFPFGCYRSYVLMNKSAWVALFCNIATVIVNFFQSYTF